MAVEIGLIGAGQRLRTVLRLLLAESGGSIRVTSVFDPDPLAIEAARRDFGEIRICQSEEELLAETGAAWIFVGSFNSLHRQHAVAALRAGKNVFCEKPLATNLEDCLAVRDAVRETGRTFAFGLVLRYSPHYQAVQRLVSEGAIGDLVSFEFNETLNFFHGGYIFGNWRRDRRVAGSHLLEKCCHDLDLANWITGSLPIRAASFGGNDFFLPRNRNLAEGLAAGAKGRDAYRIWEDFHGIDPFSSGTSINDNQVAILQYANGVRATFHTNCNTALPERRFYLCGMAGTLKADAVSGTIELRRIGHDTEVRRIFGEQAKEDGHAGADEVMARSLAATLLTGQPPLATAEDGIRSCVAAFGIDLACDEDRVVDLRPLWKACGVAP